LNSPNTIDGCFDGNSGSYRSDESLESILVYSSDEFGNPDGGSLRVGGYATVRASVFAWSTFTADTADFYYTNVTAATIAWTLLGSAGPGGSGDQDITSPTSFLLESSGTYAVRVRFRYNGSPDPCNNGGYDDADDILFTVVSAGSNPNTDSPTTSPSVKPSTEVSKKRSGEMKIFLCLLFSLGYPRIPCYFNKKTHSLSSSHHSSHSQQPAQAYLPQKLRAKLRQRR